MDWRFLATIILTVALGITTIVLALKLVKRRQPVWSSRTVKIIGLGSDAPPELKLTFNQQSVNDVYQTRVILFNKGNEAILKENVTESIAIHFKGAKILRQPVVLAKSREGIKVSAKQVIKNGDDAVGVSFQFLDHNDGVVFEVLHTAGQGIEPSGNIIGTQEIHYIGDFAPIPAQPLRRAIVRTAMIVFVIGVMIWLFLHSPSRPEDIRLGLAALGAAAASFIAMLVPEVSPFLRARRFPRWSVVKS
jgi:hypothetical protein